LSTFLVKVDVTVSRQNVENRVEKTIDEQNEADEERAQQYTGSSIPLTRQQCSFSDNIAVKLYYSPTSNPS